MRNSDLWVWRTIFLAVSIVLLVVLAVGAQSVSVLYHFGTNPGDPIWFREIGLIVEGLDGNLYGTSPQGGTINNQGTVFKMTLDGKLTVLYNFDGKTGGGPLGGLTRGSDGTFYGTTYSGGKYGVGTIFRVTPAGQFSVLYNFRNGYMYDMKPKECSKLPCVFTTRQRLDASASYPISAPVFGADGNLYGVTSYSWNQKFGVLYKISPGGGEEAFTALCTGGNLPTARDTTDAQIRTECMFNGTTIGNNPVSMIAAHDGNFYGVTYGGLPANPYGSVFKASQGGQVSTLHKFNLTNGSGPFSVMEAKEGDVWNLYGTTAAGGNGNGVVYKVPLGTQPALVAALTLPAPNAAQPTVLHNFSATDGLSPVSGLVQGADGKLYGTTKFGGSNGRGVVYRISPKGTDFQILQNFETYGTGRTPLSTPMIHKNNVLYGVTYQGGSKDAGALYCMPLPPSPKEYVPHPKLYKLLYNDDQVRVETGVTWTNPIPSSCSPVSSAEASEVLFQDGIAVTVKCRQNPQLVQFVHRERVLADGTLEGGPQFLSTATCKNVPKYCLTTNPAQPEWRIDTQVEKVPYYRGYRVNCDKSITTYDAPNFQAYNPATGQGFDPKKYRLWRATFVSFVLCNGQVIRQIHWTREMRSDALGLHLPGLHYNVGRPMPPDPELVKKFQCISNKQGFDPWAPSYVSLTPTTCSPLTIPDKDTGAGCPPSR
jgi:uncharacterized repeat protein (TIGR03803 family)